MNKSNLPLLSGQLFITTDFGLTDVPQSQHALRTTMSASSLIRRKKSSTETEDKDIPHKFAKLVPIQIDEEDFPCGQEVELTDFRPDVVTQDEEYNTFVNNVLTNEEPITEDTVTDPPACTWIKDHITVMTKKKENNCSALIMFLMTEMLIPLEKYKQAYKDFSTITGMDRSTREVLFRIMSLWGRTNNTKPTGIKSLMDFVNSEHLRNSLSTIQFPVRMRKTLVEWLTTYSSDFILPPPQEEEHQNQSVSLHTTLPSPVALDSHTSTSYTPALGTSHFAGAQGTGNSTDHQVGNVAHVDLARFQLKTSKALCSISFNQAEYRCTLRSPNNVGDLAIKLETYMFKDIAGKSPQDYWRSAMCKGFVLTRMNSKLADLAAQMEAEMIRLLQSDPKAEGEYMYRK